MPAIDYEEMARKIAERLTDDELLRLQRLMDADSAERLFDEISAIVQQRHPELFASPAGIQEPDHDGS